MAGGGGARGRIAGIVRVIKTEIGHTIKARRHFTEEFHQTGVATITSSVGKGISGNSTAFLIMQLKEIGEGGKKTGIGKNKITGACAALIADKTTGDIITRKEMIIKGIIPKETAEDRKMVYPRNTKRGL